jgi:uncharacterized protein YjbI with pentapeptide repeats
LDENHQDNAESKLAAIEAKVSVPSEKKVGMPKPESKWPTTPGKWIELLGTPLTILVAIAGLLWGVYQFNAQQSATAEMQATQVALTQAQALDQQRQATLVTYFDRMQELFLAKPDEFKAYKPGDEYQALAVARTWTALRNLDGVRKAILIRFLWEAKLINGPQPIISLNSANLLGADFNSATLRGANLSGAFLAGANFVDADLKGANLSGAYLTCGELDMGEKGCTDLRGANLGCIDLSGGKKGCADLSGAYLMGAKMDKKTDLRGTILKGARYNTKPEQQIGSNGAPFILPPTQWPLGFVPKAAGAIICNVC